MPFAKVHERRFSALFRQLLDFSCLLGIYSSFRRVIGGVSLSSVLPVIAIGLLVTAGQHFLCLKMKEKERELPFHHSVSTLQEFLSLLW